MALRGDTENLGRGFTDGHVIVQVQPVGSQTEGIGDGALEILPCLVTRPRVTTRGVHRREQRVVNRHHHQLPVRRLHDGGGVSQRAEGRLGEVDRAEHGEW